MSLTSTIKDLQIVWVLIGMSLALTIFVFGYQFPDTDHKELIEIQKIPSINSCWSLHNDYDYFKQFQGVPHYDELKQAFDKRAGELHC